MGAACPLNAFPFPADPSSLLRTEAFPSPASTVKLIPSTCHDSLQDTRVHFSSLSVSEQFDGNLHLSYCLQQTIPQTCPQVNLCLVQGYVLQHQLQNLIKNYAMVSTHKIPNVLKYMIKLETTVCFSLSNVFVLFL